MDQVVFKSAYMERSNLAGNFTDPNKKIKYLGVFTTGSVFGSTYADISLNTAIVKLDLSGVYPYTPEIRSVLNTFDNTGGTYFRYVRDSNFTSAGSGRIAGYTPSEAYVFDVNSYYSLLAFDNSQNIIPLYTLMGSYVPYPPVSYPYVVNPFEPSQEISSFVVPTGGLVKGAFPASFYIPQPLSQLNSNYYNGYNNPPTGTYNQAYWPPDGDIFQSRYEQSMPIKTTLLHTAGPTPTVGFSNALKWYPTDSNETNLWFNPPGSNLTLSNVNLSNTFMGGFPVLSKGPYFIMLNNNFTASNTSNGTIMNFQYVVASNNYINYSNIHPYFLSNINWEGRMEFWTSIFRNTLKFRFYLQWRCFKANSWICLE